MSDVVAGFLTRWRPAADVSTSTLSPWQIGDDLNASKSIPFDNIGLPIDTSNNIIISGRFDVLTHATLFNANSVDVGQALQAASEMFWKITIPVSSSYKIDSDYEFDYVQTNYETFYGLTHPVDADTLITYDNFETIDVHTTITFESSFIPLDISRTIVWGYGLNNFLVGGTTNVPSTPEDGLIDEGTINHINFEVYRVVNIVNMKESVTQTSIDFDNFSIQRDIESFAWTVNFDVLSRASFDLIRPVGRTLKTIEVDINSESFTLVVAKSSIQRRQGEVVYRCNGWSRTKLLADPYAGKRSFRDTQARTAAQIVNLELTGTGFTYTWETTDWLIPIGVHSYQDKTPLGAILEVVNAIGAVIEPHPSDQSFRVRPYYPFSPWAWATETPNRTMNERQFFETSSETIPRENPDGVYVYGEETSGVGVKAVRAGKAGIKLLPDVVNRYITVNTAGQERGRIEVAKNSFIERIPMSTYIDTNGIIMPHELIEFTDLDNNTWRGLVLSTKVDCQRVGTALIQTITVARFYDD